MAIKKNKVFVETIQRGEDGTKWYYGSTDLYPNAPNGDFCLNEAGEIFVKKSGAWIKKLHIPIGDNPILNSWFGTRAEYNALSAEEKNMYCIHFIEEGT